MIEECLDKMVEIYHFNDSREVDQLVTPLLSSLTGEKILLRDCKSFTDMEVIFEKISSKYLYYSYNQSKHKIYIGVAVVYHPAIMAKLKLYGY